MGVKARVFRRGLTATRLGLLGTTAMVAMAGSLLPTLARAQAARTSPAPASTEAALSQTGPAQVEEVVVTASKRAEVLSRAPLTVSAVTQASLDQQGISDTTSLSTSVPNLQVGVQATGGAQLSVRGISSNNVTELGNAAVAFYVDGIYEPRTEGVNQLLYDVNRIEVLRGPQGTLYGRNATAGSVNVITADPTKAFEGGADVSYGSQDDVNVRGMINVPITDRLAVRATVTHEENDGYFDNKGSVPRNYESVDQTGVRLTALWNPIDAFTWRLSADYFRNLGAPPEGVVYPITDGLPLRKRPLDTAGFVNERQFAIRSRMTYQFTPSLSVTYLAGYGTLSGGFKYDADGTSRNLITNYYIRDQDHYSNEVDINYDTNRFKLIAGAYAFDEHPLITLISTTGTTSATHFYDNTISQHSRAGFGQGTYSVTDRFRLTLGLRYTVDEIERPRQINYTCPYNAPIDPNGPPGCRAVTTILNQDRHYYNLSYKGGAEYDLFQNTLAYGSISTGYKAGGLGNTIFPDFGPEHIMNYEFGVKSRLFEGRLQLTGAIFYSDYSNLQVTSALTLPGTTTILAGTTNAAAASVKGIEAEVAWALTPVDRFQGYFTYLDASYDSFKNAIDTLRDPTGKTTFDASGNPLVLSPPESFRLSYQHNFHAFGGTVIPDISFYWQDAMYLRPFGLDIDKQKSYSKSDFTVTYNPPITGVAFEGYVHNIEDSEISTNEVIASGSLVRYYQPPRTFGVRVRYAFK